MMKKHPVIHGSCSDHVISVVLQLMICGCMDLTSMSTAQMCLPFVIDEVHCSLPQIGRMLYFRERQSFGCVGKREPSVSAPPSLHFPSLFPHCLLFSLQGYKHSTEAPHWQARHIQKDSAEPEAVGQTNMNASQDTASPTAHNEHSSSL